ncbi:MAG TPA: D-amino-acid transaminase [Alphaproteobacteria bacterium]|nr:D-amino-acid transaminase [Alphaproteobacteria bacterium]
MPHLAYVNGRFVPHDRAAVHIEDRGFQFADGVYEVVTILGGRTVDEDGHLDRLDRSLSELEISKPMERSALKLLMHELVRRNRLEEGILYIQVTRGVAPRDFRFPRGVHATLVMTTRRQNHSVVPAAETGVRVVTVPEIRWARRDIKSVGLLAQVLAKQAAAKVGAFEAWMVDDDGFVTEGASSNAWIVTKDGVLVTRQADHSILKGITGNAIAALAEEINLRIERRPFTPAEAYEAREAFLTSATTFCLPIVEIDGHSIANGHPGGIATQLRAGYLDYARKRQSAPFKWRY